MNEKSLESSRKDAKKKKKSVKIESFTSRCSRGRRREKDRGESKDWTCTVRRNASTGLPLMHPWLFTEILVSIVCFFNFGFWLKMS